MAIQTVNVTHPAMVEAPSPEPHGEPCGLALDEEAARLVARLTRDSEMDGDGSEAVRVAAFNSFI